MRVTPRASGRAPVPHSSPTWAVGSREVLGEDGRMGAIQFRALLQPRGPAAAVILDDAQVAAVGEGARRFPVVATVNGYTWRTSVARMGGEFLLGLSKRDKKGRGRRGR